MIRRAAVPRACECAGIESQLSSRGEKKSNPRLRQFPSAGNPGIGASISSAGNHGVILP